MDAIKTVCVCGAGTMGSGIAQVCAMAGCATILYDLDKEILQKAKTNIENNLIKLVEKQKLSETEQQQILQRLQFTFDIDKCIGEIIIEAIVEKIEAKISLFNHLLTINNTRTIFASNTSSLSITEIAKALREPEKMVGLHFFNPATLMKLIEVVKTAYTKEETLQTIVSFVRSLNKTPVICNDSPGFIVNRVARPFYIESLRLIEEGKASFEIIDRLLENRGFKMGPFKLMDLIGNDINYAVSCSVYEQLEKPARLQPSDIQKEKVDKGELGKKTGKGYYQY